MPIATAPGLITALQATLRGTKVWATAWTPPPIWKTTNNKNGSGEGYASNKLDPAHYQDYANYLADFVDLMAKDNVPIIGLSPANEPDYTASWDGAQWTPAELTTFISQNLGPTFAQRFPSVKIIAPDTASWPNVDQLPDAAVGRPGRQGLPLRRGDPPVPERQRGDPPRLQEARAERQAVLAVGVVAGKPEGGYAEPHDDQRHRHDEAPARPHGRVEHERLELVGHLHQRRRLQRAPTRPRSGRTPPSSSRTRASASPTCSSAATRWGTGPSSCARGSSASPRQTSRRAVC